ncbi:MAG: phospholipase D-like domain-containing protein [Gammaproteobacteria bacterium]
MEHEKYYTFGFKVFPSVIAHPDANTSVKTFDHPVQSFYHDDFTCKPGRTYRYFFHPLKGKPKNLDRGARPIVIEVRMEALYSELEHDVFFNRGVASSQAYVREFGNERPDQMVEEKRLRALQWLSRDLDEAMLKFIADARAGDTLLCCFYEFRYEPVADALKAAIDRRVDVHIIMDAKVNESTDSKGKFHPSFPRVDNLQTVKDAGIPKARVVLREAKPNNIAHNKFMVLLKGKKKKPTATWTGSTNLSMGGIHGQTNVGHWVRDAGTAAAFQSYWNLLKDDPGPHDGDDASTTRKENTALRKSVEDLGQTPTELAAIPAGITPVFSPRSGGGVLDMYADLVADAEKLSCITLAFGIGKVFKDVLKSKGGGGRISFFLLEKADKPAKNSKTPFVAINASNNVYKAWGSYLRGPLYQWARETNAGALGLNQHVSYIHSKFLLRDPLGLDPLVVTGSANFSAASTNDNDENMLLIRGNQRVADIYFTEFNRLFFHYYFRSVQETTLARLSADEKRTGDQQSLFLAESDDWVKAYKAGSLKRKRVDIYLGMQGFER